MAPPVGKHKGLAAHHGAVQDLDRYPDASEQLRQLSDQTRRTNTGVETEKPVPRFDRGCKLRTAAH